MKTTITDLSPELVEEILSKVPLTSLSTVRSTLKQWNALSKDRMVCKAESNQLFLGFLTMESRVFSVTFDLKNFDLVDPSVKKIGKLDQFKIRRVFHCDGLVLCVTHDQDSVMHETYPRLVAWNPYLGQTRLIELRNVHSRSTYGFGYDSSRSYKILRFVDAYIKNTESRILEYEIYDFDSNSWKVLDVIPDWYIDSFYSHGVSLKGNTYWIARDRRKAKVEQFLLCFDFTRERFGPRLNLPSWDGFDAFGVLACVREEKLAVMFQHSNSYKMEIWVTTKIEPEFVLWSKFLMFDMTPSRGRRRSIQRGNFFIDEEKKTALFFELGLPKSRVTYARNIAYMIGEDGYYMEIDLGESSIHRHPIACSYVPSLVQIE